MRPRSLTNRLTQNLIRHNVDEIAAAVAQSCTTIREKSGRLNDFRVCVAIEARVITIKQENEEEEGTIQKHFSIRNNIHI